MLHVVIRRRRLLQCRSVGRGHRSRFSVLHIGKCDHCLVLITIFCGGMGSDYACPLLQFSLPPPPFFFLPACKVLKLYTPMYSIFHLISNRFSLFLLVFIYHGEIRSELLKSRGVISIYAESYHLKD